MRVAGSKVLQTILCLYGHPVRKNVCTLMKDLVASKHAKS